MSVVLALAMVAATGPVVAQGAVIRGPLQPKVKPAVKDRAWQRVGGELRALDELYRAHLASGSQRPFDPQVPFVRLRGATVAVDAVAEGDVPQLEAALAELGATDVVSFQRVISARLPLAAIPRLVDVDWLRSARPAIAVTAVGATTSQGDAAMRADIARSTFSVDGTGMTVGALSDSFDCGVGAPGSYATDLGTLDLPSGIQVLADTTCGIDEGRAMLQLIHDVAPGADLAFHTAFVGMADFALGIEELAGCPPGSEAGCSPAADPAEVIVDDVGYFASPMFQDGVVAQAVDVVHAAGVSYFSSAGNSGAASHEGNWRPSGGVVLPGTTYQGVDAHDFDPGLGSDNYQSFLLPSGSTTCVLQWDEPFASVSGAPGSASDLDFYLYDDPPGSAPIIEADAGNIGADPVEIMVISNGGPPLSVTFAIGRFSGIDPGFLKWVCFNSRVVVSEYGSAGTLYGHSNAAGAIATGAAYYGETPPFGTSPPLLEPFSSAGGTPVLFDASGTRLTTPEIRFRPQIVAPDGTNTTFFGSDDSPPGVCCEGDGFPNFFGTSAAAPHAAAAAALMLDASSGLTPAGIESVMTSSAIDMTATTGFDFDSGFGLLDVHAAVGSVAPGPACDGAAELVLAGTPSSAPATFSATTSIWLGAGVFDDLTARAPLHVLDDGATVGGTSGFYLCPP